MAREDTVSIRGGYVPFTLKENPHLDILQESMRTIDERHHKALDQRNAVATAIASLELNEKEDPFKKEYTDKTLKEIDDAAKHGNYASALTKAKEVAGKVASDPAILSRQRYQEQYKAVREKVRNSNNYSALTKDWWDYYHPYDFKEKKNEKGEVIGGNEFKETDMPVDDINWEDTAKTAFDLVSEQSNASEWSRGDNTDGTGYSRGGGSRTDKKDSAKIKENIVFRYEHDNQFKAQVDQAYSVAKWHYEQNIKKLESLDKNSEEYKELEQLVEKDRKLYSRNGSFIPYDEFVTANIYNSTYAKNLGYTRTATRSENNTFAQTDEPTNPTRKPGDTPDGADSNGGRNLGAAEQGKDITKPADGKPDVQTAAEKVKRRLGK